jgi:hypothetical protein
MPGRKPIPLDLEEVEKLAAMHCTDDEIAAFFGIHRVTFAKRKKGEVLEAIERGRGRGRASLRRQQWALAQKGNATMLIWLGKQLLGQKDKSEHEVTGREGAPLIPAIQVTFVKPDDSGVSE